ncbi:MAG TPA: MOSC domain-containing protein [Elusimicrobiota bacterium]|nr:MOSC domain-containing protein [Elusimicrobiota bacterium]
MAPPPSKIVVRELWRYPVKSLLGERLESAEIGPAGVAGDRAWAVRDAATGRVLSAKRWFGLFAFAARYPAGPGEEPEIVTPRGEALAPARAAQALSDALGLRVELVRPRAGETPVFDYGAPSRAPSELFFDAEPVHVIAEGCLAALRAAEPSADFDPRRFRPNLVVSGADDAALAGNDLAVGKKLRLRVRLKRTGRCVMTTLGQDDLPGSPKVLKTVARRMEGKAGTYARILSPGTVAVGDVVLVGAQA